MAFPQGFLFQPAGPLALPFGTGLFLGPRAEEFGRSGSAFAPYSSSSHLQFGAEPRAAGTISSYVVSDRTEPDRTWVLVLVFKAGQLKKLIIFFYFYSNKINLK